MDENAGSLARFEETLRDFWATRPVRPRSGGKLAGVSAGIGARYGIDPVLIRIGFVLLTFYGGSGLVLYLLGWLLLPKESEAANDATSSTPARSTSESTPAPVATVLVVLLLPLMLFWVQSFAGLAGLLAGFAALYLLHRHYADRGNAVLRQGEAPAAASAGSAESSNAPIDPGTPVDPGTAEASHSDPQQPSDPQHAPHWDPLGTAEFAWDLPEPPAREPAEPEKPGRPWISVATVLLALAVAGLSFLAGQRLAVTTALALAVVGAGMIVGSFRGAGRGLIGVAIPLGAIALLLSALGSNPMGRTAELHNIQPDNAAQLAPSYEAPAGGFDIDLTGLPEGEAQPARTKVWSGVGDVVVRVPAEADVTAGCRTRVGTVDCLGRNGASAGADGNTTRDAEDVGADGRGGGRIVLDLTADVGDVEVRRE